MIDFYYWTTPNGHKITIFLEEAGIDYNLCPINIGRGDQFETEFLKISPNNRIPAIVDHNPAEGNEPISLFESGAILLYLSDKTGLFNYPDLRGHTNVLQWLMWQMGGLGPMAGQNHHFTQYAPEPIKYAIDRYVNETARLYAVLNKQLGSTDFVAGDDYTIADMACYPWTASHEKQSQDMNDFPNLKRWFEVIKARPATIKAYEIATSINPPAPMDNQAKALLFNQDAATIKN